MFKPAFHDFRVTARAGPVDTVSQDDISRFLRARNQDVREELQASIDCTLPDMMP
jgi:hypothetical protein